MDIKDTITLPSKVLGVEYCITPDGVRIFSTLLQKKKQELLVLENREWNESDLETYLKKEKIAVKFIVTGKGLLTTSKTASLNKEEFCLETRIGSTTMIRKEAFPDLISNTVTSSSYAGATLGAPFLYDLVQKLNIKSAHSFCYDLSDEVQRPQWEKVQNTVHIGDEKIESVYLGSYLVALSVYLKDIVNIFPEKYKGEPFFDNLLISRLVVAFGALLLVIVLVNFFVWDHLAKENRELSAKAGVNQGKVEEAEKLTEELKLKTAYFEKMGLDRTQYLSFYADRIGVGLPKSVQLQALVLNPFDETKLKKEKLYEFATGRIKLNGWSKEILPFNQWVSDLKELEWIEQIEVLDYKYNSRKNMSEFHINLELK